MKQLTNLRKELENKIKTFLLEDGKDVNFVYDWIDIPHKIGLLHDNKWDLKQAQVIAFTTNKNTSEKFLLKSAIGENHVECLEKILNFIISNNSFKTFTVNWSKIENGQTGPYNTSFFYCHDMLEVVNKFFVGKSTKDYIIYDIKMNPIS